MNKAETYSEELALDKSNELDLTDHHENISAGIKNIKRIYQCSLASARKTVEESYVERISKIPNALEFLQKQLANIKYQIISLPKNKKPTKFGFNLLKCCSTEGLAWTYIEGFENSLTISTESQKSEISQNRVSEISLTIITENDSELCTFKLFIFDRLSKIPTDQLILMKNFTIFENFKNAELDFCICLNIELSNKDKNRILLIKGREILKKIEKQRIDALGINIRNEFKSGCCDCFIN